MDRPLTTGELERRFGLRKSQMKRWFDRGWVHGTWLTDARGSGGRLLWDPWVERIVPVLLAECRPAGYNRSSAEWRAQIEGLARALRRDPDAPFFVWDGYAMVACFDEAEAVRMLRSVAAMLGHAVLVAPPELD